MRGGLVTRMSPTVHGCCGFTTWLEQAGKRQGRRTGPGDGRYRAAAADARDRAGRSRAERVQPSVGLTAQEGRDVEVFEILLAALAERVRGRRCRASGSSGGRCRHRYRSLAAACDRTIGAEETEALAAQFLHRRREAS